MIPIAYCSPPFSHLDPSFGSYCAVCHLAWSGLVIVETRLSRTVKGGSFSPSPSSTSRQQRLLDRDPTRNTSESEWQRQRRGRRDGSACACVRACVRARRANRVPERRGPRHRSSFRFGSRPSPLEAPSYVVQTPDIGSVPRKDGRHSTRVHSPLHAQPQPCACLVPRRDPFHHKQHTYCALVSLSLSLS